MAQLPSERLKAKIQFEIDEDLEVSGVGKTYTAIIQFYYLAKFAKVISANCRLYLITSKGSLNYIQAHVAGV